MVYLLSLFYRLHCAFTFYIGNNIGVDPVCKLQEEFLNSSIVNLLHRMRSLSSLKRGELKRKLKVVFNDL